MPADPKPVNREDTSLGRILIADDSQGMRLYLRTILAGAGFDCTEAADGAEAFDLVLRADFDVLVTDLDMPRMDGFELVSAIDLLPPNRHRPAVVVISARGDEGLVARRPEMTRVARVLTKPVGAGELLDVVAASLPIKARCI